MRTNIVLPCKHSKHSKVQPRVGTCCDADCDGLSRAGGGAASYGGSHTGGGARVTSIYDSEGPFGGAQPPPARRDAVSGIDYDNDYTGSGAPGWI